MQAILKHTADNPRHRLQEVASLCSKQHKCEAVVEESGAMGEDEAIRHAMAHSGCGKFQPKFKRKSEKVRLVSYSCSWGRGNESKGLGSAMRNNGGD